MIRILFAELGPLWEKEEFDRKLQLLPMPLQGKILLYPDPADCQIRIMGKLLLRKMIHKFGLIQIISLDNLVYNAYNRPYFPGDFDFNISHSGDIVVCAALIGGKIGIDIEKICPGPSYSALNVLFSVSEQRLVQSSTDPLSAFFGLWTKKEALLKASGLGVFGSVSGINFDENPVNFNHENYYLYPVPGFKEYQLTLASTLETSIEICKVSSFFEK
jgi:4'-phosphopantetheinyl transferase